MQANVCKDPLVLYKHMLEHGIGTQFAMLYEGYAKTLCDKGHLEDGIALLKKGIQAGAKPQHLLQSNLENISQVNGGFLVAMLV